MDLYHFIVAIEKDIDVPAGYAIDITYSSHLMMLVNAYYVPDVNSYASSHFSCEKVVAVYLKR